MNKLMDCFSQDVFWTDLSAHPPSSSRGKDLFLFLPTERSIIMLRVVPQEWIYMQIPYKSSIKGKFKHLDVAIYLM
jgi:hypothetical protein